jgi:hypothetical protein
MLDWLYWQGTVIRMLAFVAILFAVFLLVPLLSAPLTRDVAESDLPDPRVHPTGIPHAANVGRRFVVDPHLYVGSILPLARDKLTRYGLAIWWFLIYAIPRILSLADIRGDCGGNGVLAVTALNLPQQPSVSAASFIGGVPVVRSRSAAIRSATSRSAALSGAKSRLGRSSVVVSNGYVQGSVGSTWLTAIPMGGR